MENNYWDFKDLIVTTRQEKEKLLAYEIWMFRETCAQITANCSSNQFEINLLLESLSVHTRLLLDFFYNDLFYKFGGGKDRLNKNDIIAQDFLSNNSWIGERPKLTQTLRDAREKANKQLAHLSTWRIKIESDGKKSWEWAKIHEDMEKVIAKFESLK
ncbi:MAG: hypothetical protein WCX69_00400 [Candidatus Paceibacterota bacterium]